MSPSFRPFLGSVAESSADDGTMPGAGLRGRLVLAALNAATASKRSVATLKVHNRL